MGIRKSVFGSEIERVNFQHLARGWGQRYRLYHNLPFFNVLDLSQIELDDIDESRLKKTSIDYTLCDNNDRPLLCVEFDGLQNGFNIGQTYYTDLPSKPWRDLIMTLKLKVAHESKFPFVVIGATHFKLITPKTKLAIVDGIIGQILAHQDVSEKLAFGFEPEECGMSQADFDELTPARRQEVVQGWVTGVEVEADLEHNPISRASLRIFQPELHHLVSTRAVTYPDADRAKDFFERAEMIEKAITWGCEATVQTKTGPRPIRVMLPNFNTPGICPFSLSEEIAYLIALDILDAR